MPDPTPYVPGYDFTASDKGAQLNVELADVSDATVQLAEAIADIRRSDGGLQNGIVTADSLDPTAVAALTGGDVVAAAVTACQTAQMAAEVASAAGSTFATNALASATAADASATAADGSADAADASALAAAGSALAASGSATAANASAVAAAASAAAAAALPVGFLATRNNSDQTGIVSATATKLLANSEVFDEGADYDTGTARWTPPAGRYRASGVALFTGGVVDGSQYRAMIYVNGVLARQAIVVANTTASLTVQVAAILVLNGTDFVEFFVQGDGAGNKTVSGSPANTWFEGSAL